MDTGTQYCDARWEVRGPGFGAFKAGPREVLHQLEAEHVLLSGVRTLRHEHKHGSDVFQKDQGGQVLQGVSCSIFVYSKKFSTRDKLRRTTRNVRCFRDICAGQVGLRFAGRHMCFQFQVALTGNCCCDLLLSVWTGCRNDAGEETVSRFVEK